MLGIFSDQERALRPSTEIKELTFLWKRVEWCFPGCLFLEYRQENLKLNVVLAVVLVLKSKALSSPLQKLQGEWVQVLGAVISGIVWVDKC